MSKEFFKLDAMRKLKGLYSNTNSVICKFSLIKDESITCELYFNQDALTVTLSNAKGPATISLWPRTFNGPNVFDEKGNLV